MVFRVQWGWRTVMLDDTSLSASHEYSLRTGFRGNGGTQYQVEMAPIIMASGSGNPINHNASGGRGGTQTGLGLQSNPNPHAVRQGCRGCDTSDGSALDMNLG